MLQSEHYDYIKQDSYMFLAKFVLSHEKHCLHFDQNRIVNAQFILDTADVYVHYMFYYHVGVAQYEFMGVGVMGTHAA